MFPASTTRPPIPQGRPPPYAFINRMYSRNLRPVVIACGLLAAIWTLIWGVSEFQNISLDRQSRINGLVTFDIVLGSLYLATTALEAFGVFAAVTQKLALIRVYTYLSLLASLLVLAAEAMNVAEDFKFKQQLLNECVDANTNTTVFISHGWWGESGTLTPEEATNFCHNLWNRNAFADFAWLIVSTILSLMFAAIAFSFYRQALDPSSSAYPRAPSDRIRMNAWATSYNNNYPPPAGPPPQPHEDYVPPYDPSKLPDYGSDVPPRPTVEKGGDYDEHGPKNPFEERA